MIEITSKQLAEVTSKRHSHVTRDIDAFARRHNINLSTFVSTYIDKRGTERRCYVMPERLAYNFAASYHPVAWQHVYTYFEGEKARIADLRYETQNARIQAIQAREQVDLRSVLRLGLTTDCVPDERKRHFQQALHDIRQQFELRLKAGFIPVIFDKDFDFANEEHVLNTVHAPLFTDISSTYSPRIAEILDKRHAFVHKQIQQQLEAHDIPRSQYAQPVSNHGRMIQGYHIPYQVLLWVIRGYPTDVCNILMQEALSSLGISENLPDRGGFE